ncbi:replication initiator protein A [Congzhengia minquanensis]
MSLSVKNRWFDDNNRVYIIYTLDEIIDDLRYAR